VELAVALVILFFSIILHEVAHGVVAHWNGDTTARDAGRLTLNPLPHIDPIGSVVLPALLVLTHAPVFFGWAKPVPFNPRNFRNWRFGVFTVGLAGPVTNLLLAVLFSLALRAQGTENVLSPVWFYGASINVFLALFNLVPIPPLDGSRAVLVFLPPDLKRAYASLERWGFVILLALLYTGVLSRVLGPVHEAAMVFLTGLK